MEPFTPNVLIAGNPLESKNFFKKTPFKLFFLCLLITIIAIPLIIGILYYTGHKQNLGFLTKLIDNFNQQKSSNVIPKNVKDAQSYHPQLFYANLEFDPKTNIVTLRKIGKTNGDRPKFSAQPPASSSADFIYKVEVLSDKNEILQKGWDSIPKEVITTPKGIFRFNLTTIYQPNASVRLYLSSDKILWTGKMQ